MESKSPTAKPKAPTGGAGKPRAGGGKLLGIAPTAADIVLELTGIKDWLVGYGQDNAAIQQDFERRLRIVEIEVAAQLRDRADEILRMAIAGPVYAQPTIEYDIGKLNPLEDDIGIRYLKLRSLVFSTSSAEPKEGPVTTRGFSLETMRGTDVEVARWASWTIPIDLAPLRQALQRGVGGTWIEVYEDQGQEFAWGRFEVSPLGDRIHGSTVLPNLTSTGPLDVRQPSWDPATRKLTFALHFPGSDQGDPLDRVLLYDLLQTDDDTLEGQLVIERIGAREQPESRKVVWRRLIPTAFADLVNLGIKLIRTIGAVRDWLAQLRIGGSDEAR